MVIMTMTQGEEERRGDEICNACVLLVKVIIHDEQKGIGIIMIIIIMIIPTQILSNC